jgi:hypothetical protein
MYMFSFTQGGGRAQRGSGEPERRRREATGDGTVAKFIDP